MGFTFKWFVSNYIRFVDSSSEFYNVVLSSRQKLGIIKRGNCGEIISYNTHSIAVALIMLTVLPLHEWTNKLTYMVKVTIKCRFYFLTFPFEVTGLISRA